MSVSRQGQRVDAQDRGASMEGEACGDV